MGFYSDLMGLPFEKHGEFAQKNVFFFSETWGVRHGNIWISFRKMGSSPRISEKNGISPPKLVIEYDSIMVSRDASVDLCREIVGYDQQLH